METPYEKDSALLSAVSVEGKREAQPAVTTLLVKPIVDVATNFQLGRRDACLPVSPVHPCASTAPGTPGWQIGVSDWRKQTRVPQQRLTYKRERRERDASRVFNTSPWAGSCVVNYKLVIVYIDELALVNPEQASAVPVARQFLCTRCARRRLYPNPS